MSSSSAPSNLLDFSALLEKILTHLPYSSWQKVTGGPDGSGAYRDTAGESNPSLQLSKLGLYDFKEGKWIKNLVEVGRDLGIEGLPGKKKRRTILGKNQVGVDEEREKTLNHIRKRLGLDLEGRRKWLKEQWPIIKKYFCDERKIPESVCGAKFFFSELNATVQTYTHKETKEEVTEILLPMFGVGDEGKLIQVMKIQVDKNTGKKIGKKLKGTADEDRAIVFGAKESDECWIFEGIENALSAYVASSLEERSFRAYIVAGPAAGFGKLGRVAEGYARRVVVCDPDLDRKSLRASAILGEGFERIEARGDGTTKISDLNDLLREGGIDGVGAVREMLQLQYKPVGWAEVSKLVEVEGEREELEAEADSYEYHGQWNPFSDQAAAKFFVRRFGDRVKISEDGRWWVWGGKVWTAVHAVSTIRQWIASLMPVYLKMSRDQRLSEGDREAAVRFAKSLGMASRQGAVMKCLPGHKKLQTKVSDFDANPDILNVENGVLDLVGARLLRHEPRWMCSKMAGCGWDETGKAKCPVFDKFMTEAMCADTEAEADLFFYKMRQLGYLISGHNSEKAFFFHIGLGDNGKSKESEIMAHILGDYARPVSTDVFLESGGGASFQNQILYEMARFPGVRMLVAGEPDETKVWSETIIKKLTSGGDEIVAREIKCSPFGYIPVFKVVVHGNSKPRIKSGDRALWNRLHLIPYDYTPPVLDKQLGSKLKKEAPAILRRLVEGFQAFRELGLSPPARVIEQIQDYQNDITADVDDYIEERCEKDPLMEIKATTLYHDYLAYCKLKNIRADSQAAFGRRLNLLGFEMRKSNGKKYRLGLVLKSNATLFSF